jgi:hypothetical protein
VLRGLLYQMAAMAGNIHRVAGQLLGALLVGDAGLKFGDDRERMYPEPFLDDAAVPEGMQTLARAAPCADVIAAPVILGCSLEGLVNVADLTAEQLQRRKFLLVGRVRRSQDGESPRIALTTDGEADLQVQSRVRMDHPRPARAADHRPRTAGEGQGTTGGAPGQPIPRQRTRVVGPAASEVALHRPDAVRGLLWRRRNLGPPVRRVRERPQQRDLHQRAHHAPGASRDHRARRAAAPTDDPDLMAVFCEKYTRHRTRSPRATPRAKAPGPSLPGSTAPSIGSCRRSWMVPHRYARSRIGWRTSRPGRTHWKHKLAQGEDTKVAMQPSMASICRERVANLREALAQEGC